MEPIQDGTVRYRAPDLKGLPTAMGRLLLGSLSLRKETREVPLPTGVRRRVGGAPPMHGELAQNQCETSEQRRGLMSRSLVTPPRIHSRMRLCP
jgi:hypothetical protein